MTKITQIPTSEYTGISELVIPGSDSLYTEKERVPEELATYAYPSEGEFCGVLAIASRSSENPPNLAGITPRPDSSVVAVNTIRYDEDPKHGAHVNIDRSLLFQDAQDHAFRLSQKDHPAHFRQLSNDTGLGQILNMHGVPNRPNGPTSELSAEGSWSGTCQHK